jgi:hypothetical protein
MGPFGLGDGAFNSYMIDLPLIVSLLPLSIKIGVGTFGYCENCVMGGEGIILLWKLLDLWRRWLQWVGFCIDLRIGIAYVICGTVGGYVICGVVEGWGGWLWRSDTTSDRTDLRLGCFGKLAVERAKGKIESIGGGEPITWYG